MSRVSATLFGPMLALLLTTPLAASDHAPQAIISPHVHAHETDTGPRAESARPRFLQAAEITSVSLDRASVTAGGTLLVTFTTSGTFDLGNDFLIELSSADGSFTAPTQLPTLQTGDRTLEVRAPCDLPTGSGYRVRLLSTAPRDTAVTATPLSVTAREAPTIVASSTSLCEGDSARIDAGPGFASYLWSSGQTTRTITVHSPGRYQVEVTDAGGCRLTSAPVDIVVNPRPFPTITRTGNVLQAPAGFARYRWSTGETSSAITIQQSGEYRVTVTDANGCEGISAPFNVTLSSVAMDDDPEPRGLTIVSVGDAVMIRSVDGTSGELLVTIADVAGRIVERRVARVDGRIELSVPMTAHPAGFYLVAVEMGEKRRVGTIVLGR